MLLTKPLVAGAVLSIAVLGSYAARMQLIEGPRLLEMRAEYESWEQKQADAAAELLVRSTVAAESAATLERRVLERTTERARIAADLNTRLARVDVLSGEVRGSETEAARQRLSVDELEHAVALLEQEVARQSARRQQWSEELDVQIAQDRTARSQMVALEQRIESSLADRVAWEERERYESVPRLGIYALAGRSDDGTCTGLQMAGWLARPMGQRLGVVGGVVVEDRFARKERVYLGPAWQKLLSDRLHVDLWAGGAWYATDVGDGLAAGGGATLGFALPRWRLGIGVTAILIPETPMIALALGTSQMGMRIDPYE